ncbi:hypothetical protein D3C84_905600 [compost metagenome]
MLFDPFAWADPIPALERSSERALVGVAEDPGDLNQGEVRLLQIAYGHRLPGLIQYLLERGASLGQMALQGART